jgi:predicted porin
MQRKIIALAIAGFAATAGSSQAYDFNVNGADLSLYGILDGSVYTMHSPNAPSGTSSTSYGIASNNMQTSRLGFKASDDLGNGLKVNANLEEEISLSTGGQGDGSTNATPTASAGGGGVYNRAANVGLSGSSWGEVKLGRQIAPSFLAAYQLDALGSQSGGFANAWIYSQLLNSVLITGHGTIGAGNSLATNLNFNGGTDAPNLFISGLSYISPVFSGVQVRLLQTFGSNNSPVSGNAGQSITDSGITDLTISYDDNGPLVVRFADQQVKVGNGGIAGSTYTGSLVNNVQLGGSYKFGDTKVTLDYGKVAYDSDYKAAINATGGSAPDDVRIVSFGATQQITTALKLGLSYTTIKDTDNTANGVNEWSALADYTLSKKADVYAQFTAANNKGGAQYAGVYGAVIPTTQTPANAGGSVNSLLAGIRYKF